MFEISHGKLVPWIIIEDGDGKVDKGFKGEWMTVKDKQMYIGSIGKVWTSEEGVSPTHVLLEMSLLLNNKILLLCQALLLLWLNMMQSITRRHISYVGIETRCLPIIDALAQAQHIYYGYHYAVFLQVFMNNRPQYIKVVNPTGHVEHRPWASVYNKMRSSAGIVDPGYIIHESGAWSEVHKKWFFLPRRASTERWDTV